ncbi:unnamed protein product [Acidocella sp. C78]|nr:unnamed protein product [Acidocella sp. C78]
MAVSIKDVARAAGVSPATVSRTLGGGAVSAALRDRVEEAVRRTGYRPNLSARRLRSQESQTVGLIVADISNPFFTAVARAVEHAAYAAGLRVILCNTDENPEKEAMYLQLMEQERVTGVIFAPTRASVERLDRGGRPPYPMVLIDRAGRASGQDAVVLDNFAAGPCWSSTCSARATGASPGCSAMPAPPASSGGTATRRRCAAPGSPRPRISPPPASRRRSRKSPSGSRAAPCRRR